MLQLHAHHTLVKSHQRGSNRISIIKELTDIDASSLKIRHVAKTSANTRNNLIKARSLATTTLVISIIEQDALMWT